MVSIDRLNELLRLDPATGKLFWKVSRGRVSAGSEAGTLDSHGYQQVRVDNRFYRGHRVVFALSHGRWPTEDLDHINGITTDNRPQNLREATDSQNLYNARRPKHNTSGVKGVTWHRQSSTWHAVIRVDGRAVSLRYHADIESARAAVAEARARLHGEFART